MAGGKEEKNKEVPTRAAKVVVEKSSGLWGISQCWRGVVQQQVELGGLTVGAESACGTPHWVGVGGALEAWGGHRAVPGLCGAWRGVGRALPRLPPWRAQVSP